MAESVEETVEGVEGVVDWGFVGAEELGDVAGGLGSEAFLEIVDTVVWAGLVGEALDTVEVITLEAVFSGVFDHVPLNEVLGVVFFHVLLVATRKEVNDFGAVGHEHSGGQRCRTVLLGHGVARACLHRARAPAVSAAASDGVL